MRSLNLIPGLLGLTFAIPYDNAPDGASSVTRKRDTLGDVVQKGCKWATSNGYICQKVTPDAYGPKVTPDTLAAFSSYNAFSVRHIALFQCRS